MSDAPAPGRKCVAMSACDRVMIVWRARRAPPAAWPAAPRTTGQTMDERKLKVRTGGGVRNMRVGVSALVAAMCPRLQNRRPPLIGRLRAQWAGSDQCCLLNFGN